MLDVMRRGPFSQTMSDVLRYRRWLVISVAIITTLSILFVVGYSAWWQSVPTIIAGSLCGVLLGLGIGSMTEFHSHSYRSVGDVCRSLQVPILGIVPSISRAARRSALSAGESRLSPNLIAFYRPDDDCSCRIDDLATRLVYSCNDDVTKVIQITSADRSDGKTVTLANLAIGLAKRNLRVLVIDSDFQSQHLHAYFGMDEAYGLSDVFQGTLEAASAVRACADIPGLHVLASGNDPDMSAEMIQAGALAKLVEELRDEFDFILLDSSHVLDPAGLAPEISEVSDSTVMVVRPTSGASAASRIAVNRLRSSHANLSGVVLSNVPPHRFADATRAPDVIATPVDDGKDVDEHADVVTAVG